MMNATMKCLAGFSRFIKMQFRDGNRWRFRAKDGGAEGSRTPDLLIANETLYQLSYDPIQQAEL